ncbi:MAG: tRNA lysidine(34) synthetase TilS [Pseudomonadota bacterium]
MITLDQFSQTLKRLSLPPRALIAVSGGRDSMALALLCGNAVKIGALRTEFIAVTVDHGLRKTSAAEANTVKDWCAALGLAHRTVRWERAGARPESAVQARARDARYALLCKLANTLEAGAILTGHTLDDQAETVWMRMMRGSGPSGLAGMRHERLIAADAGAPVRLVRPFLSTRRKDLTTVLQAHHQPFLDDPSNANADFERVRTRGLLSALAARSIIAPEQLAATARRCARQCDQEVKTRPALARAVGLTVEGWGGVTVCAARWARHGASHEANLATLAGQIIGAVGQKRGAVDPALAFGSVDTALGDGRATLGGCLIEHKDGVVHFYREPAAFFGRDGLETHRYALSGDGRAVMWDQRFLIKIVRNGTAARAEPGPLWHLESRKSQSKQSIIPVTALRTLPVLVGDGLPDDGALITPGTFDLGSHTLTMRCIVEEAIFDPVHRFVMPEETGA